LWLDTMIASTCRRLITHHRSHTCGELRLNHVGDTVQLSGWLQNTRKLGGVLFLALRDQYGVTQVKVDTNNNNINEDDVLDSIKPETVITIGGKVLARPTDAINTSLVGGTGEIEVELTSTNDLNILNSVDFSNVKLVPQQLLYNTNTNDRDTDSTKMASEELRLQYRHIDLRRKELQKNLKLRAEITLSARNHLSNQLDFTEIETPVLFKSTPEGAREFLVPTRRAGEFYALPQSPQQHKQLLMCGGIDRYYQVARCFRDESGRSDRQPEFTQLDIEMAFVDQEDIMKMVESTLSSMFHTVRQSKNQPNQPLPLPNDDVLIHNGGLPRMTFCHAMNNYGSDKPDIRYGLQMTCLTKKILNNGEELYNGENLPAGMLRSLEANRSIRVLKVPYLGEVLSKREIKLLHDDMINMLKNSIASTSTSLPEERLIIAALKKNDDDGSNAKWVSSSPACRFLSDACKKEILSLHSKIRNNADTATNAAAAAAADDDDDDWNVGDLVVLLGDDDVGSEWTSCETMGWMRSKCAELIMSRTKPNKSRKNSEFNYDYQNECSMMWVIDFPLFEIDEYNNITATHHPFTAPQLADEDIVRNYGTGIGSDHGTEEERRAKLLSVKGQHYDIVCNGVELGGGSIRIHDSSLQTHVFKNVLKLSSIMENSFQHLTDALGHGCPPHGGKFDI
jgi:aspartyl-tRNA synthetase